MKTRWTRLLTHWLTALLLLAAAGPAAHPARATEDLPPQEVLKAAWYWESWQKGAQAGSSAAGAGDVNGDGYADVIVGAPKYEAEVYKGGAAFLFRGLSIGLEVGPHWIGSGESQGNAYGSAVASAGDVNCDGYADVIVGAPNYGQNHGKVYVYHGSPVGLSTTPDWTYTGETRDIFLGGAVASAGDVNGDGCDEVIVGAKFFSDGQEREGGAFLFYGSPDGLSAAPGWIGQVDQAGAQFGYAVSGAGDLNRDGYADVIVGAPYFEESSENLSEGGIFLYFGSAGGLNPTPGWAAAGGRAGAKLGWSVSAAGDVNYDGYPDLAAGAPGGYVSTSSTYVEGMLYVYYGSGNGPSLGADWSHAEPAPYSGYGEAVAGAGDVNGDSIDDLLVGAWRYSNDQSKEGALFVHHGGPNGLAQEPGWRAEGDKADTGFGYWVAAAGDVTRDGYGDIVVGAPYYRLNTEIMGRAFVYHGFYQEVVDGEIVPIDPGDPIEPVLPAFFIYLPVMTY